jgi:hypothetical protein
MITFIISTFAVSILIGLAGLFWFHNADKRNELDVNKLHHNDYIGEKL